MFILSLVFLALAIIGIIVSRFYTLPRERALPRNAGIGLGVVAVLCFVASMFTTVGASRVGIVTTFGAVGDQTLTEGAHFVLPWQRVVEVPMASQTASASKSVAGSRDMQTVHSTITVNYHVTPGQARALYVLNPSLTYQDQFVVPATYEVFKAVVARYTAEDLITKRAEVSEGITAALNEKLRQYSLQVQGINLVDFGFSRAFDAAIEEKVTATQKAETAKRNLERVKFEAESRIAQAEGEAKAIAIQSQAIEKSGGAGYVQLQAISKWDGKLPATMASGAVPFLNLGK